MLRERRAATGLARSVVGILRDADLAQIRFELYGTQVSGQGFSQVACLVESGDITVRPLGIGRMGGDAGTYSPSRNVLTVDLQHWTVAEKSAIIHEAVHAMTDINAPGQVDQVEHEAAAFVAGAWYFRIKTGHYERGRRSEVADRVVTAFQSGRNPADVDLRELLDEVRRNYTGHYHFDGVESAVVCVHAAQRTRRRR
ncbi:MAG: hypothetical protein KIT83_03675 [Bryobacterales bacterium]|nr:hypothetical protein [Bryobacterales bacterium]